MTNDDQPISPLWLLADRLSVTEAALLLVGREPQGASAYVESWGDHDKPPGYLAARRAIVSAISKKIVVGGVSWQLEPDGNGYAQETDRHDFDASWVDTDSLRKWLHARGFDSAFFSFERDQTTPGYLKPKHPRYAPKLAAAVEAWEKFEGDDGAGTAKQKLMRWLRINAGRFGLVDEEGKPAESVIEEIAKVSNWARSGGAPKQSKERGPDFDDEIPF